MLVDILVKERDGDRGFFVPWLPEKIDFSSGGTVVASYDIMNRGPVEVPTGTGLSGVSWSSIFPGINRQGSDPGMLRGSFRNPQFYHSMLEDWRRNGTVLTVMVYCYPINLEVTIEDYSAAATGAFGDWEYTVKFKEHRELTLWLIKPEAAPAATADTSAEPQRAVSAGITYTIKKGDSLWKIAAQQLGNGTRWKEIFDLNHDVLEQTAQKYKRHCTLNYPVIYAGTVIALPAK